MPPRPGPHPERGALLTAPFRLLPDYVILGARCCGTTSLQHYLVAHPHVESPLTKEIHFFDDHYARGAGWYRAHFPLALARKAAERQGARLLCGEASPFYLYHPLVPARLHTLLPAARLLVLLRDPVDRAYSHYQQIRREGEEPLSFAEALAAEAERIEPHLARLAAGEPADADVVKRFSYATRGHYAEQLERWLTLFPREQLLVLRSEDLFAAPAAALLRVWAFLGLEPHALPRYPRRNAGRYEERPDPDTRARLLAYFRPHNRRLAALLGEDFGWEE